MNCIQHDDQGTSQDQPTEFYAQVILTVTDQAPLLGAPRLARQTMAVLASCGASAPGELWAYVVLPDSVRLIVGRANEESLETFVALVKRRTHTRLMELILRSEDNTVDAVLRYNPMWGGVNYQVWQAGSHRAIFWTEYKLSHALYELRQAPVAVGLVTRAGEWPYSWVAGNDEDS
jgi:REP element-mobilizing transposase RayT